MMSRCEVCSNLRPDTLLTSSSNTRSIIFASRADLKSSAHAPHPCSECALIWNAWTHHKSSNNENDNDLIEIMLAARMPLLVSSRQDSMQVEIFSGWIDERSTKANDDVPIFLGPAVAVAEHSGHHSCFELSSKWLHDCEQFHPACKQRTPTVPPTRLLDVGSDTGKDPFLIETKGLSKKYVALSYCWGEEGPHVLKTTAQTVDNHKQKIPYVSLPKTLQDAVTITRYLGLQYLWIDALCIIQGDADDWNRESSKMCQTYLNAHLTISADNSSSASQGIFTKQAYGAGFKQIQYKDRMAVFARKALAKEHSQYDSVMRSPVPEPINQRAWTLQEALLSNRILRYTSNELIWECNGSWLCECGSSTGAGDDYEPEHRIFRDIAMFSSMTVEQIHGEWDNIMMLFTERSLGEDKDKLPALSGLANQFASVLRRVLPPDKNVQYLAGLWGSNLVRSLRWFVEDDYYRDTRDKGIIYRRPKAWRAPSWSWASIEGPVVLEPLSGFTASVRILEASTLPLTVDPYGQVSSAQIVVRSRVLRDLQLDIHQYKGLRGNDSFRGFTLQKRYMIVHGGRSRTFTPDCIEDFAHCKLGVNTNVVLTALLLGNIQFGQSIVQIEEMFLVLIPVDASMDIFKRVGVSIREYHEPMATDLNGETNSYSPSYAMYGLKRMFEQAPEATITIV